MKNVSELFAASVKGRDALGFISAFDMVNIFHGAAVEAGMKVAKERADAKAIERYMIDQVVRK